MVMDTTPQGRDGIDMLVGGFGPLNGQNSRGVERYRLVRGVGEADDVALDHLGLLVPLASPTWLAREGDMVYAVLENTGEIASLRLVRETGGWHAVVEGTVPVRGSGPTHAAVAVDDRGVRHLIAANYGDGSLSVHGVGADGVVGAAEQWLEGEGGGPLPAQQGPHAHWVLPLPDGRVLSTDLGADRIRVHRWSDGRLVRTGAVRLKPGTGPRDMHLLPTRSDGWRVAVVDEWGCGVTVLRGERPTMMIFASSAPSIWVATTSIRRPRWLTCPSVAEARSVTLPVTGPAVRPAVARSMEAQRPVPMQPSMQPLRDSPMSACAVPTAS